MSDEDNYNEKIVDEIDQAEFEETGEESLKGQFFGNDLAFEMQIRNPKSEEKFPHLNRDISGAFFDKWDKAKTHENLLFLRNLTVLYEMGFEDLDSTILGAMGRVAEIGVVSQGVDGNLQKTRISRFMNRRSELEEKKRSRFKILSGGN